MIDTHCHLNQEDLYPHINQLISDAIKDGVKTFLVVGWDVDSSKLAVKIAEQYDFVYAGVGIHPTDSLKSTEKDYLEIEKLLTNHRVIALGEIGLDFYWNKLDSEKALQKKNFVKQIELANKYKKPVLIHSRDASQETLEILQQNIPLFGGIMHCYSASAQMTKQFMDIGMYISLGGTVTFKNAKNPKEVARIVPLDRLFVETDSPYLSPEPNRGKQNTPANVIFVASEIAKIRNVSLETIEKATDENFERLFHVKTK